MLNRSAAEIATSSTVNVHEDVTSSKADAIIVSPADETSTPEPSADDDVTLVLRVMPGRALTFVTRVVPDSPEERIRRANAIIEEQDLFTTVSSRSR